MTSKIRGGEILPEINAQWILDELDDFATRDWDRFEPLTEDEKDDYQGVSFLVEGRIALSTCGRPGYRKTSCGS